MFLFFPKGSEGRQGEKNKDVKIFERRRGKKIKNKHTSVAPVSDDTLLWRELDLKPQKLLTVHTSVFIFCRFLNHPVKTL